MKTLRVIFLGLAVMALLITLTGMVFADIEGTVTIAPGESFVKEAIPQGSIQIVQTSFNASASVRWILTNPTDTVIHDRTAQDWTEADYLSTDTYTWTWQNTGSSPLTLNYTITHVAETQESTDASPDWWLIGGIAAAIIVVIVIAFVFWGRKKKE